MTKLLLWAGFLLLGPLSAEAGSSPRGALLPPDPRDFSLISGFSADWCTEQLQPAQDVQQVCLGKSRFRETESVRSLLVKRRGGVTDLYVEDEWPVVELWKPKFGLVGPVHPSSTPIESGEVLLFLDRRGEELGIRFQMPSTGTIRALR